MSERIYAWLLRLYPSRFRQAYGDEALQLFRDRARDEKGFFPRLRLWLDLLADLAISIPREYRHPHPALIGASAKPRLDRLPAFQVLKGESPRFGAVLLGGVLSLGALGAFSVLIGHGGSYRPLGALVAQPQPPASARRSVLSHPAAQAANDVAGEDEKLDAAERRRVVDGAVANLKKYYIDPDIAQKTADALLVHEKSGDDDAVTDGGAFADLLTRQMSDVSHDQYLVVMYNRVEPPERRARPTPEDVAFYRKEMEQYNCTFEKVKMLPHNIGYVKVNSFPDASICQQRAAAAMASLNHADAIIFDLRDNRGGYASMVALMATYLFDHPTHLNDFYTRVDNSTKQSWTLPPVPGNRLADKPAYVLTSASTFSAAEAFSYDLKMLKRATLVGETTSGRGHIGMPHRIDDHFEIRVPGIRAINPISKTNWEGTGVEPDVKVKAADALETAERLAESKLQKK